jgi:hypothetical protein
VVFTQAEENFSVDRGLQSLEADQIEKLKLEGNVVLGDFIFNTIDEFGIVWVLTDLDGWWTPPPADVPSIDRGFGDGGYDVRGRFKSRNFTLEGVFLTPKPELVEAARDRLISSLDLVRNGAWFKTGTNPIRASFVYLVGAVDFDTVNPRGRTKFSMELRASDPVKYAWNPASPDGYEFVEVPAKNFSSNVDGIRVIDNIGNYKVPCYLEVSGPFTAPGVIYNRTTDQLIIITQGLKGTISRRVVNKELRFDVPTLKDIATITTTEPHDFSTGDAVFISGVGPEFDGDQIITSTPTNTTFTYEADSSIVRAISHKAYNAGVATIDTVFEHELSVGDRIIINGVDLLFDGSHVVTSVPNPFRFTYSTSRISPVTVSSSQLTSNIATLSTTQPHQFISDESVTVAGVGTNYDGTFQITSVPSDSTFSYAATRTNSREIINRLMSNDVVTLTTQTPHGFFQDEFVNVTGVNFSLNGGYQIQSTTQDTFTYRRPRVTERSVIVKSLTSNVATLTTSESHGYAVGESVIVSGVDQSPLPPGSPAYDGTHTITAIPSANTFSYTRTFAGSQISTSVTGGLVRARSRRIRNRELIGNVATIITDNAHGVILGESVTVSGVGAPFDGTYTVTGIPFLNVFTYSRTSTNIALEPPYALTKFSRSGGVVTLNTAVAHGYTVGQQIVVEGIDPTFNGRFTVTAVPSTPTSPQGPTSLRYSTPGGADFPEEDAPNGSTVSKAFGFVQMSGTIASGAVSPPGLASVGGSLPFVAANGSASVEEVISRRPSGGNLIKPNEVVFTPGLVGATAVVGADLMEINTKDREVAFNGELRGARGRIDVLADFIELAPGENRIEFEDTGNPESLATLRVYYRSGWLG